MRKVPLILITTAVLMLSACERDGVGDPRVVPENTSVEKIFALAQEQLNQRRPVNAGDYYLEVERLYPFTSESERALILAAQAYHDGNALVESRVAAERYLQFFPGGKSAALAQYLIALSYYNGIVDISRDQERTFLALQALQKVMDNFPNTEYAELSKPKFEIALNQLAGKEMEIGRYYLRRDFYTAAIARFKAVIEEYPANKSTAEAYHRLIEAYLELGLVEEARAVYAKFQQFGTNNPWFARSQALIETGRQPDAGFGIFKRMFTS